MSSIIFRVAVVKTGYLNDEPVGVSRAFEIVRLPEDPSRYIVQESSKTLVHCDNMGAARGPSAALSSCGLPHIKVHYAEGTDLSTAQDFIKEQMGEALRNSWCLKEHIDNTMKEPSSLRSDETSVPPRPNRALEKAVKRGVPLSIINGG